MATPPARSRRTSLLSTGELDRARVLDTLVNNLDGMAYRCLLDASWRMIFVSQGCLTLTGYRPDQLVDNATVAWESITHPQDSARVRSVISAAVRQGQRFAVEYRILTQGGLTKWVIERGIGVADERGELVVEGFIEDVTEQHSLLEAREQAERRYREIFEHASEGIFQTTADGHYLAANPALARIYGYASPEALMAGLHDIDRRLYVRSGQRERFQQIMTQHGAVLNFESEVYRQDGTSIWISENAHAVRDPQGQLLYYEGTVQDISERRSYQEQLERQANHDALTGLPNRNLLGDRVEQGIARAARLGYNLAVVFIDLDNFKFINDSLGHDAGDELLKEVARRLGHCVRGSDTVARLGGDEFVLLLTDHYQSTTVISQLRRVLEEVSRPLHLVGREFQINASLGVALYPQDGEAAASLLKHADAAMYAAKDRGRNTFQFFTSELNREADERLNLENALRQTIEQNALEVHYQPKVDHRRRIVGLEALVRWTHPVYGAIRPDRFIPIAEETGLIVPLTHAVLRDALAAAAEWNRLRATPLHMAVNLSPRLFYSGDIVAQVSDLLAQTGFPADLLELEITENVFIGDSDRAVQTLHQLKELGVLLAMDDFGTGYSSLSYLRRLPLDIIKIDRSLVTGLEHEEDVAMIARAVISLGQSLRKVIVAEGVENQAQFDFLRYQGCNEFQGYLLSRPLSHADMTRLLEAGSALPGPAQPNSGFAPLR
ncbi:MAG: EAL domain-containing protein [Hylemonella sp.]|nr:EAL domain-containing protein [Hylemonella sp.]